jgi:hypothetical protein
MQEEDIYMEECRLELLEDDEISAEEEGFMLGYEDSFDFSFY